METFEEWLDRTGRNTKNVGALSLAEDAWTAALAQSRNYVADQEVMPEKITFANGRVVYIADNTSPGVHNGVYLEVEQLPNPA
jgi:hypothetical protein